MTAHLALLSADAATRFERTRNLLFSELDGEYLAVDAASGQCLSLSETAWRVWQLLGENDTLDGVCARLQQEYRVDRDRCVAEVAALIDSFSASGLVRACD